MSNEMSGILFRALCACLELTPASRDASAMIRPANPEPENPPRPGRNDNVIYYDLLPENAPDAGYPVYTNENPQAASALPAVSSFLPYRLVIVCYGPECEWNARRIRSFLYLDGSGYPRSILRKAGIYPVPRPAMPVLLNEEAGGLIRRRADLVIPLRIQETLVRTGRRNAIRHAPAVTIVGKTVR